MTVLSNLDRLALEDPKAAAAVVDALWSQLAREDARMFAALWRRAHRSGSRAAGPADEVVEWLDELEEAAALPSPPRVDLRPERALFRRVPLDPAQAALLLPA